MKCPNCKANIDDNSNFCDYCGTKINKENFPQQTVDYTYAKLTDTDYINAFTKNNKTINKKFNIYALIFGSLYIYYKKQYILGIIITLITIFCIFKMPLLIVLIHILLGFIYNYIYLSYTKNNIKNIKLKYINKSEQFKLKVCSIKGGSSFLSGMFGLVVLLVGIVLTLDIGGTNLKDNKGKSIVKTSNVQIANLNYEIPKDFEVGNYNTDEYKSYTYNKDNNYCRIKIETQKNKNQYNSIESYLSNTLHTKKTDTVTLPIKEPINNILWDKVNVQSSVKTITYYATLYEDTYYLVYYEKYNNDTICYQKYDEFIKTLTLKK